VTNIDPNHLRVIADHIEHFELDVKDLMRVGADHRPGVEVLVHGTRAFRSWLSTIEPQSARAVEVSLGYHVHVHGVLPGSNKVPVELAFVCPRPLNVAIHAAGMGAGELPADGALIDIIARSE
jgi:hypothetical protein